MEDIRAFLAENAEKMGICLTDEQTEKFQTYAELLVEWNEKISNWNVWGRFIICSRNCSYVEC